MEVSTNQAFEEMITTRSQERTNGELLEKRTKGFVKFRLWGDMNETTQYEHELTLLLQAKMPDVQYVRRVLLTSKHLKPTVIYEARIKIKDKIYDAEFSPEADGIIKKRWVCAFERYLPTKKRKIPAKPDTPDWKTLQNLKTEFYETVATLPRYRLHTVTGDIQFR